jgi:glycerol-3-phosphate O-acyltransferase
VAWAPAPQRRGPWPAVAVRATQTLVKDEQLAVDERPAPDRQVAGSFGLASVLEQQLYDQEVKEETRIVREEAKLPWWKRSFMRLADDLGGLLTYPIRLARIAKITKEVSTERMEYYKAIKDERRQSEDGDDQPQQGLGGDPGNFKSAMKTFFTTYMKSHVIARTPPEEYREMLNVTLTIFLDSLSQRDPYSFEPFHKAVRGPDFDYYSWGNRFFRPLVKYRSSRVDGLENVRKIKSFLASGENVVLMANHQTEADPQVLSILLEMEGYEDIAEKTIFLAGHKVTTDPLAIPFSMGRNLLTIFSKKYLDSFEDGEYQEAAAARNRQTVAEMQRLLTEGGNIFWVAPSGGRDRRDPQIGEFAPAKFDASSVGLFNIMAKRAEKAGAKTHFFPLGMWTHRLVPPPDETVADVGEERRAERAAVGISFGEEIRPEEVGGRKKFPDAIEKQVNEAYWAIHDVMRLRK